MTLVRSNNHQAKVYTPTDEDLYLDHSKSKHVNTNNNHISTNIDDEKSHKNNIRYTNNNLQCVPSMRRVRCTLDGESFCIWSYYQPIKILGRGAYAVVLEAIDIRDGSRVAIKKNKNVFADVDDAKRILREIQLLSHFKHPNIIQILDVIPPQTKDRYTFNCVLFVMPKIDISLSKLMYTTNAHLTSDHRKYIIHQILFAVEHIHAAGVIHRDLTPHNILIDSTTRIKLIDFGLARGVSMKDTKLTEYVCTRWYRAPEIMLSRQRYNKKVDAWSIGCIFAELLLLRPLFPGNSHLELLQNIMNVLGTPKIHELYWITDIQAHEWVQSLANAKQIKSSSDFRLLFKNAKPEELEVLKGLLVLNPRKRISIGDAMEHPFFACLQMQRKIFKAPKYEQSQALKRGMNTIFGARSLIYDELNIFSMRNRSPSPSTPLLRRPPLLTNIIAKNIALQKQKQQHGRRKESNGLPDCHPLFMASKSHSYSHSTGDGREMSPYSPPPPNATCLIYQRSASAVMMKSRCSPLPLPYIPAGIGSRAYSSGVVDVPESPNSLRIPMPKPHKPLHTFLTPT